MTNKISDKDKKDWEKFINSSEKLENKDKSNKISNDTLEEGIIDLHGFSLDEANVKISEFIEESFKDNVRKIIVITGKGLRSKNLNDPYKSNDLSILKYSVPNYINNNSELMEKILKIDFDSVKSPSKGFFEIILKKSK